MRATKRPASRKRASAGNRSKRVQKTLPPEFRKPGYMSLRHVAFAVQDPSMCARFCVECLDMVHGPQTTDFRHSGMRWVEGRDAVEHPFKLHFIPNESRRNAYVDVLNRLRTLINGNLDVWTQLMDNHICVGYHDASHLIERIVRNDISAPLKKWYRDNVDGNSGHVPYVGPVHRQDDVYQFYAMMPFGIIVEIQQPRKAYTANRSLPDKTSWEVLRPEFISGEFDRLSKRDVSATVETLDGARTEFRFTARI